MAILRVPRGQKRPGGADFRAALARDREQLRLPPAEAAGELAIAGPYPISLNGAEPDARVGWAP